MTAPRLDSLDMFTSVWSRPDIAHLLVSFGFSSGQHVVFSVEIRRENGEEFNEIGGFFRQFEQVLIAATEEDIVKLRTTYRKEDVGLYPLKLRPEMMRGIFMSYVSLGNELAAKPVFYNTVTGNCASTVYRIAEPITGKLPFDMRLLKTGGLPEYLDELGALDGKPLGAAKVRRAGGAGDDGRGGAGHGPRRAALGGRGGAGFQPGCARSTRAAPGWR
mgnify:CR=1 FL=1